MNVSAAHRPNIAEPEQAQQLGTQIEGEEIAPSGPTSVLSIFWSKFKAAVSKVMLAIPGLHPYKHSFQGILTWGYAQRMERMESQRATGAKVKSTSFPEIWVNPFATETGFKRKYGSN